ncbi:ThuA domain-containing protein [Pseudothermotoga sp.]
MKLFSFLGDRYHDKKAFFDVLSEALKKQFGSFQVVEGQNLEEALRENPNSIVIAKWGLSESGTSWLDERSLQLLTRWVENGGRLFVWHSGLARYPQSYAELVGGRFIFHPERTSVRYFTEDGFSFEIFDEHYFVELRGNVEVFLWSESIFGRSTAGWKKLLGSGKILTLTPAHDEEALKNEKFKQLLEKSLNWLLS